MKKLKRILKNIRYDNVYLLVVNIYIVCDIINKLFILNQTEIDVSIYLGLHIIYMYLLMIEERRRNK